MMAYAIGIIMSLSGMMKGGSAEEIGQLGNIQGWFMNLAVPIAIPLILFSSHFTLWFKTCLLYTSPSSRDS